MGNLLLDPEKYRRYFTSAEPFPHIVLDNLFPNEVLEEILRDFPEPPGLDWKAMETPREKKLATKDLSGLSPAIRNFLLYLNSGEMVDFLEKLTGIEHLVPDPHYWGGGLHQIPPGGFLKIHADFNWHNRIALSRRLNLLIYLNKDWEEEYGGQLELWDNDMTACQQKIMPIFNRTVVFATTDFANHGHPTPMTCPPDRTRKSIAIYYYSNGRPKSEVSLVHSTQYKRRGPLEWEDDTRFKLELLAQKVIPPIFWDAKRYLKTKFFPNKH